MKQEGILDKGDNKPSVNHTSSGIHRKTKTKQKPMVFCDVKELNLRWKIKLVYSRGIKIVASPVSHFGPQQN